MHTLDSESSRASRAVNDTPKCSIHPSRALSKFCQTCGELLCERCEEQGRHKPDVSERGGDSHVVVGIAEAAETERTRLRQCMETGDMSECVDTLEKQVKHARRLMAIVNDESERESEKITLATDRLVKLLRADEKRQLDQVDAIRWQKLKALERHEVRSLDTLETAERSHQLAAEAVNSLGDGRLLQVSGGLARGMEEARSFTEQLKDVHPVVFNHVTFVGREKEIAEVLAPGLGTVINTSVCERQSHLECPKSAGKNEEVAVTLSLRSESGEQLPQECLQRLADSASVAATVRANTDTHGSDGITVRMSLVDGGLLRGSFTPKTTGRYTITATLNGEAFPVKHSPACLFVEEGARFQPSMCIGHVSLSNGNKTARKNNGPRSHATAFFSEGVTSGCHTWRLQVSSGNQGLTYSLGVGVFPRVKGLELSDQSALYGFEVVLTYNTAELKDGDTLCLTLDCDSRKYTLQLWRDGRVLKEKTNIAKQLSNTAGFFPYAYLYGPGDSFTILPNT